MQELLRVSLWAPDRRPVEFEKFIVHFARLGYEPEDGPTPFGHCRTFWIPTTDRAWKREVQSAVKAGAVAPNWSADWIEYRYTDEEVATAPLFDVVHVGRCIDFPLHGDKIARVCHITDVNADRACTRCGVGARQSAPLRLAAAELNKAGRLASIWLGSNTFWMVSDDLLRKAERAVECRIPVQPVTTIGKAKPKHRWWQLMPSWAPPTTAISVSKTRVQTCKTCKTSTLNFGRPKILGNFSTASKRVLERLRVPPILCSPFWEGDLDRTPDGRIAFFPSQRLMLRGDLARFLKNEGIRGLDVTPVVYQ
ncbi:MAG TPA: hypothetical protein PKE29_16560 [Phycisphaerales bacterium]|nr:hypothetical protein [Phycisphaerales bacterium]